MSYDIDLCDPVTKEVIEIEDPHFVRGGTFKVGGNTELTINITYNYGKHYYRVFGEGGIRNIYGMTGGDSIKLLEEAISELADDVSDDYWEPTEGNAKKALYGLLSFAKMRPDGVWSGD